MLSPADSPQTAAALLSPRLKLALFGALIVAVLAFFATMAFRSATVYYLTVSELGEQGVTADGRLVRVAGKLVKGSYERAPNGLDVSFQIRDEQGQVLPVGYVGEVGQLFFNDHSEIVAEGALDAEGLFHSHLIIVKCPTKYAASADGR